MRRFELTQWNFPQWGVGGPILTHIVIDADVIHLIRPQEYTFGSDNTPVLVTHIEYGFTNASIDVVESVETVATFVFGS